MSIFKVAVYLGNARNAELQNVKKTHEMSNAITSKITFCTFLYSKKKSEEKTLKTMLAT